MLSAILRDRQILRHNKQLKFFISETDCPEPYDIYWKVRNVGPVAESKNCIRGQIEKKIYILTESIQIFKAATMLNAIW